MTGFDSESDRRDAIRKEIVTTSIGLVMDCIKQHAVTQSIEERRYLEIAVAARLIDGIKLESMSMMMRQEIATAEEELDAGQK